MEEKYKKALSRSWGDIKEAVKHLFKLPLYSLELGRGSAELVNEDKLTPVVASYLLGNVESVIW